MLTYPAPKIEKNLPFQIRYTWIWSELWKKDNVAVKLVFIDEKNYPTRKTALLCYV